MTGNKRFVSYMYEYRNDEKKENIGYSRIESRGSQCKIFIHISLPSMEGKLYKAYMFYRKASKTRAAYLGNILIQKGIGELTAKSESNNVMNSDLTLDDMCGVIIFKDFNSFVAGEWDELPITSKLIESIEYLDQVHTASPVILLQTEESKDPVADQKNTMENERGVQQKEERAEAANIVAMGDVSNVTVEDANTDKQKSVVIDEPVKEVEQELVPQSEDVQKDNGASSSEHQVEWITNFAKNLQQILSTPTRNPEPIPIREEAAVTKEESIEPYENKDFYEEHLGEDKDTVWRSRMYGETMHIESIEPQGIESNHEMCEDIECVEPMFEYSDDDKAYAATKAAIPQSRLDCKTLIKDVMHKFPRVYPFEDNEICDCVRIEPQDIGLLPMDSWVLGNNSFLLHGYYTYRHLIFGKINAPGGVVYILGVPGIFHNRESFMARMFGFEYFKCAKLAKDRNGEFGYYYIPIQLS